MRYEFKEEWQLISHGKDNMIEFIEISAPTAKLVQCCTLEEQYNKAMLNIAKNRKQFEDDKEDKIVKDNPEDVDKAEQIGYMLMMGSADLRKCYDALKDCVTKSKSTLNGEISCSSSIYDEIPYKELKGLLGEYIVSFINTIG